MADTASQVEIVDDSSSTNQINYGYVFGKLAQAQRNSNEKQINKWEDFIKNFENITVGSRTPVAGAAPWVTLEVAAGGFSTGNFMAGGELQEHEKELYKYLFNEEAGTIESTREKLNNELLTPRGLDILSGMLSSQLYDIKVPEEGALLTITYLLQNRCQEEANNILDQIRPWFTKLRFYPIPSDRPLTLGAEVSVASVSEVVYSLRAVTTHGRAIQNRVVCKDVLPSYDKLVSAVLLSCSDTSNPPHVIKGEGKETIAGDLPFQVATEEVKTAIKTVVDELEGYATYIKNGQKFRKGNLGLLLNLAKKFLAGQITDRNREVARKVISEFNAKHGLPGSEVHTEYRTNQLKTIRLIGVVEDFARVLVTRLIPYQNLKGLENIKEILAPVTMHEVAGLLEVNMEFPDSLKDKVNRAKLGPIAQLCDEGLVPSSEVLANLCPAIVASVQASGFSDRETATLYGAIYKAFKNRRSLLLLNLASQVRIEELPWVQALKSKAKGSTSLAEASKATLQDVVVLSLTHWPETMLPNKLVGVLQDLITTSGESWRLVKELAADIFCFSFSKPFLENAQMAAFMLKGSIYEKYYGVDFEAVNNMSSTSDLDNLCVTVKSWGQVAENGAAIERCMILTTHNLAMLFSSLKLKDRLAPSFPSLARKIFQFIVKSTGNLEHMDWKTRLQILKNAAYPILFAWRHMVFFLSMMEKNEVDEFVAWLLTRCDAIKDEGFKQRIKQPYFNLINEDTCMHAGRVINQKPLNVSSKDGLLEVVTF